MINLLPCMYRQCIMFSLTCLGLKSTLVLEQACLPKVACGLALRIPKRASPDMPFVGKAPRGGSTLRAKAWSLLSSSGHIEQSLEGIYWWLPSLQQERFEHDLSSWHMWDWDDIFNAGAGFGMWDTAISCLTLLPLPCSPVVCLSPSCRSNTCFFHKISLGPTSLAWCSHLSSSPCSF